MTEKMAGFAAGLHGLFGDAVLWRLERPVTFVAGTVGGGGADSVSEGGGADSGWPNARTRVAGNDPWGLFDIEEWRQPRTRTE